MVDYKTGKPPKIWDGTQLMLNAWQIFQRTRACRKFEWTICGLSITTRRTRHITGTNTGAS